jgi:hypothetical protein
MALTGLTNLQPNNIKVTGIATFDQTVGIAGTLTYEDVTNVDAVGLITARSGVSVSGGQVSVGAGTSLHSTGLDLGTGNITGHNIKSTGIITATSFVGSGANLTGISQVGGSTGVDFNDNVKIRLGTGNDLEIFHDGNDSYIGEVGTGSLKVLSNLFRVNNAANSESMIQAHENGQVELYFDNSKKFETGSGGVVVTGQMYSNSAEIRGAAGGDAVLNLFSDAGGQNADKVRLRQTHVGNSFLLESYASGAYQSILKGTDTRSVELHYQGSKKFETTSSGTTVTGDLKAINSGGVTLRVGSTNAGAAALYLDGDSDGDWSGATFAHVTHDTSGNLNIMSRNPAGNAHIIFGTNDYNAFRVDENRHIRPESDNARDLGTASYRWRNLYTTDLQLSNKGKTNDVDGTWGDWTLQEGEDKIFMINNRTGKKYSLKMEEE